MTSAIGGVVGGAVGGLSSWLSGGSWAEIGTATGLGAASGALIGSGVGLLAGAAGTAGVAGTVGGVAGGSLLSAGVSSFTGGLTGPERGGNLGGWNAGLWTGAATGLVGGGVGAIGARLLAGAAVSLAGQALLGATSGLASNTTAQLVGKAFNPSQELSLSQFLLAGVGGALGGSLSWGLTRGMVHTSGDFVGRVLSKSLNGPSRAAWFGANITAGTLGGVVGDGLDQAYLLAPGRQDGWNVGRSIFAGVQGAVASAASAAAAWRSRTCFAAGTPLRTPDGSKPIEDFRVGDWVLSRDEYDPAGPVLSQRVEEVFVRTGQVWVLSVGGKEIHTTGEHPFFAENHGWKPLAELAIGDRLLGESGDWLTIETLEDTGRYETVYNLRVSETHTYFVGEQAWGFSVWAHNLGGGCEVDSYKAAILDETEQTLIIQARQQRAALAETDPEYGRNVLATRIQARDSQQNPVVLHETFVSDGTAPGPDYVASRQRRGMHSEDLLLARLQELQAQGHTIERIDAFSERNACGRCILTDGGAIDQIHAMTGMGNLKMNHAVNDSGTQRSMSLSLTDIGGRLNRFAGNLVARSNEFLKTWWARIGSAVG